MLTAENQADHPNGQESMCLGSRSAIATVIDTGGNIHYANHAARELHLQLCGRRDVKHVSEFGDGGKELLQQVREVVESGEDYSSLCRIEFCNQDNENCLSPELYYLQMFALPDQDAVGQLIQPFNGALEMAAGRLEEAEEDAPTPIFRLGVS